MALLSRFRNSRAPGLRSEVPLIAFHRICYGYIQNDWAMVFAASMTFFYTAVSLIVPEGTQPGSNP